MLERLTINNIALITKCDLTLERGLNIMTGETGAGKSIIIDSLNYALGARADKTLIRYGETFAQVEAMFSNLNEKVKSAMTTLGIDTEDEILIINRKMQIDGKNDIRINGRAATLSMLKELSARLVDIVGQHENQFLLKPQYHIELVDNYGGEDIVKARDKTAAKYTEYKKLLKELSIYGDEAERARKIEILLYQISEIEEEKVENGELEDLTATRKKITNTEKIVAGLTISADNILDGHNNAELLVHDTIKNLNAIAQYDEQLSSLIERLDSVKIELKDIGETLSDIKEGYDFNENTLEKIENRIMKIKAMFKKYGGDYESTVKFLEKAKAEYELLTHADEKVANLKLDIDFAASELTKAANSLSLARKKCANDLEKQIAFELTDLGMKGTSFSISFLNGETAADNIRSDGYDNVEFLISSNPGSPLMPLAKIASGGEMSRIMLAVKVIISALDMIDTVVFDEIDTGISGNAATTVACKMAKISRDRQVISITHLPQISAMADCHLEIKKDTVDGTTKTSVTPLSHDESVSEISRLVGGHTYSDSAVTHATSMKKWSDDYKKSLV